MPLQIMNHETHHDRRYPTTISKSILFSPKKWFPPYEGSGGIGRTITPQTIIQLKKKHYLLTIGHLCQKLTNYTKNSIIMQGQTCQIPNHDYKTLNCSIRSRRCYLHTFNIKFMYLTVKVTLHFCFFTIKHKENSLIKFLDI